MRELKVLDQGHLKLSWEERKEFFEEELGEQVRSEVKRLLEEALEAERTDWLGVGRYVRDEGGGGIIATGITGGTWGRASGCCAGCGRRAPGGAAAANCCRSPPQLS